MAGGTSSTDIMLYESTILQAREKKRLLFPEEA